MRDGLLKSIDFGSSLDLSNEAFYSSTPEAFLLSSSGLSLAPWGPDSAELTVPLSTPSGRNLVGLLVSYDLADTPDACLQLSLKEGELYWYWNPVTPGWASASIKTFGSLVSALEHFNDRVWTSADLTAFFKLTKDSVPIIPVSPKLTSLLALTTSSIANWDAYIQETLINYLKSLRFIGRISVSGPTTGLHLTKPTIPLGYVSPTFIEVDTASGEQIMDTNVVVGSYITLTRNLTSGEVATVLFEYSLDVLVSRGLDLLEVSNTPVLILSDISMSQVTPSITQMAIPLRGDSQTAPRCLSFSWPGGNHLGFRATLLVDLYWDSLFIMPRLAESPGHVVPLSFAGETAYLEPLGDASEALLETDKTGAKGLAQNFRLTYPSPIPFKEEPYVETFQLSYHRDV